ncbi:hypothetical protein GGF46_003311 [Coemansia sp. RSA 552]|nr:hypothetical protein GGF46_003311 [Coemansia sp. RSA 552]
MSGLVTLYWLAKRQGQTPLLPDGTHDHPDHVSEVKREAYLWIGVVDLFLFTVSTLLFVYRGRRTLDINAHAVLLTSIGSLTILIVNTCFLFQFVWPGKFPCFVILWCAYPGVMLWISCTMARAMRLYILSFRNMQKLKERNRAGQMTAAQLYGRGALHDAESDMGLAPMAGANPGGPMADGDCAFGAQGPGDKKSAVGMRMAAVRRWWEGEKMQMTERRLVWYVLGSTLFSVVVCSIIQGLTRDLSIVPMRFAICPVGVWEYFPLYALTGLYCLIFTPVIVYHIWPIKDAFGIRHDILLSNMFTFVCIIMFIVQTNKGFGGHDPFWDSFLWCSLLFNMSQFTSVILPLLRSYRQSDAFTWSDNSGKSASKELFYRVLNSPDLFEKLKVYSAANFCTEITLFLEEYQVLKANTVRFYNMGEPGFDDDVGPDHDGDDDLGSGSDSLNSSNPSLAVVANNTNAWSAAVAATTSGSEGNSNRAAAEKDVLRGHLDGGRHAAELESNHDTIISMADDKHRTKASMSDVDMASKKSGSVEDGSYLMHYRMGRDEKEQQQVDDGAGKEQKSRMGSSSRMAGILRVFGKGGGSDESPGRSSGASSYSVDGMKPSNTATLAVGGAAIGNLPQRRNSRGEDIMVISQIPPFTPVRYTVLSTLMQTPAGMKRQGNINTFKTLPFALRGDYYGFYSTFIADGATLQINVEGRISEVITRLIHSQQYTVDMMDEAHTEVLQLLYDNIFKKFVRIYHRDMASVA